VKKPAIFIVTVVAEAIKPVALILQEAKDALLLSGISNGVAANLTLPATAGNEGVTVTWTSNNEAVLSGAGVVNRQSDQVTVTLTATLSLSSQTLTKTFDVVVLPFAPYTTVADLAAAIALGKGSYARVPDVTVVGLTTDGYMIYDGATLLFVYTGGAPAAEVVVGAVFTITGLVDYYNGSMQFNGPKDANTPTVLIPSLAAADVLTPRVITGSISDYIATLPTAYTEASPLVYEYITVTTKVRYQDMTNYGTFFVNTNHNNATNIDSSANSPFTTDALMLYYKSNMAAIQPFNGLEVTVNLFLYQLRTDRNIYAVIFTGVADDVHTTLDDAGIVGVAKTTLAATFATEYTAETTVALPATLLGTNIVWSSASEYVNTTTGLITMPLTAGQVDASLTATITRGAASDTLTVNFKVGQLPVITIADVIAAAVNQKIRTKGVITVSEYYRTFFIQDSTGGIAIYTSNAALLTFLNANLGKEVEVFGSRALFSGMRQISPTVINLIGDGVMPAPVNVDATALNATDMLPFQGQIVSMTQLIVKTRVADQYNNITVTFERADGSTIQMKWDSRKALPAEAVTLLDSVTVGKVFDITNVLAWNNNPFFYFTASTILTETTLNDLSKVQLDARALMLPALVQEATPLTLPVLGANGSTIVWVSSHVNTIDNAGVVVLPATGNVTVTMTATVTLNAASKDVVFTVVVGLSDAAKVDLDGAAIVVPAAVTEVSTLTLPATGSNGSAIVWASNDALINATTGAVTLPVTGTVTVVLTATLTLNAVVKDFTFNVVVGVPVAGVATDLFISEYIEGSSNNKALEIFNGTGAAVDLSIYSLALYSNGATVGLTYALTGTLANGEVLVIANSQANATILGQADITIAFASGQFGVNWNGDDAVALLKDGVVIDVFGVIGVDPGTFWAVNGDGDTLDNTLVRKATVNGPVSTWDPAQWDVYPQDTATYLGSHTMN
jgi:hypothetical protein